MNHSEGEDAEMPGIFFAIVGASGVGKDTVLDNARERLKLSGDFYFPQRFITRPADAGGEDHQSISNSEFVQRVRDDRFSLWWAAHELHYALPEDVFDALRNGQHVVANISRKMVQETSLKFNRVEVIEITADAEKIKQRLMKRGRENEAEIMVRQLREIALDWSDGFIVHSISNDGSISEAVDKFIQLLLRLSDQSAQQTQMA